MGRIFALAGCSGVGKTTLINKLVAEHNDLNLLARTTSRPKRPHEVEGIDYHYVERVDFLRRIYASDYVHIEANNSHFYGIDSLMLDEAIRGPSDALIIAGAGAYSVKHKYRESVVLVFLHTEDRAHLLNPRSLELGSASNQEIMRRLKMKASSGLFDNELKNNETMEAFLERRLNSNLLDLAYVNGQIRSGDDIQVIENPADDLDAAVEQFLSLWNPKPGKSRKRTRSCFVLMPFRENLKPIYRNHIVRALRDIDFTASRADAIFSDKPVMDDILESVRTADVVVADLTDNNPNVFYETGICHALGKKVILITQHSDVPFDLKHRRWIKYEYSAEGMVAFETQLQEAVVSLSGQSCQVSA